MLQLTGPQETPEYQAAQQLARCIIAAWPDIATSPDQQMTLAAAAKCYGQQVCDVDLLLFFQTNKPITLSPTPGERQPVALASCCLAIEVKDHSANDVRFVGPLVEVRYHQRWHAVSEQSYRQRFAVKGYLEAQSIKSPFIVNLIWLRNVSAAQFPPPPHNLIGQDVTWDAILQQIRQHMKPFPHQQSQTLRIQSGGDIAKAAMAFTEVRHPRSTAIEQSKIKGLVDTTAKADQMPAYVTKLGSQLLMFQGRGGTGKTATLLKLAHVLYTHRQARVLILTYNRVLASEMRRLLALLGVRDGVAQQSIQVQTVYSFLYHLADGFGILPNPCDDFLQRYDEYKMALEMLLSAHTGSIADIVQTNNTTFSWDVICIDEAQDWPVDERNILYTVYDYRQFVIADGGDQVTRGHTRCNWLVFQPY